MDQEKAKQAMQVISQFPISQFGTVDVEGFPNVRAMFTAKVEDDFTTFFATSSHTAKVSEIKANNKVIVVWATPFDDMKNWKSVMLKGVAEVTDDPKIKKDTWLDMMNNFYSGPDDPNYVVVRIKPESVKMVDMETYPAETIYP